MSLTALPVWPPQLAPDGTFATAEQGSDNEIGSAMAGTILWPYGTRQLDPEFGTEDQQFRTGGADLNQIRDALAYSEPRAITAFAQDDMQLQQAISAIRAGWTPTQPHAGS